MPLAAAGLLPICRLATAILARHAIGEGFVERSRVIGIISTSTHTICEPRAGWIAAPTQDLREEAASNSAVGRNGLAILLELGWRRAGAFAGYTGAIRGLEVRVVADAVEVGAVNVGVNLAIDENIVVRSTGVLATVGLGKDCGGGPKRD
ncbi:hypothetical protein MMC11_007453 [Xylographa trunciseda]|nr:hypothetical protein [Xylographa trunciseda]